MCRDISNGLQRIYRAIVGGGGPMTYEGRLKPRGANTGLYRSRDL